MLTLRILNLSDRDAFYTAFNDNWEEHFEVIHYWYSIANEDFETYVKLAPEFAQGKHIPEEHVPCITLFAFNEKNEIVGRTSIRFELSEQLEKHGGHIGYGVCPSFRRRGHATEIMKLSLDYVRANLPHIDKVLVTCDEDNIASQKTILKNGGELQDIIDLGREKKTMRFWVGV